MNYLLETNMLTKTFVKEQVVKGLNIKVEENAIYGLLGPNGSGKSTTLKMLMGILKPTSGEVYYKGNLWTRNILEDFGAIIEAPPLYSNLTAKENLQIHTTLYHIAENRIYEVLSIMNIEDTGKKKVKDFSLGMKQRLGIAVALIRNPKLLILDEPTNGLDPEGVIELRAFIKRLPEQGITTIITSHTLTEIEKVSTHIGIISNGALQYQEAINRSLDLEALYLKKTQSL